MQMLKALASGAVFAFVGCASPANPEPETELRNQRDDPNSIAGVAAFIRTADNVVIYSISAKVFLFGRNLSLDAVEKGGSGVYGSVSLPSADNPVLAEKFAGAFELSDRYYRCYDPRHAIAAVKGGSTCFIEICFECEHVYWTYSGGKRTGTKYSLRSHGDDLHEYLNRRLRAGGVTLSADVKDEPKSK